MPIYEYKCVNCGHQLEMLQKMSDDPVKTCPECNEDALKKMVSAAAFKLTGTGWYETDFKDKKQKTENKSSSGTSDKSTTDDSNKKSDTTSTTKSETKSTETSTKSEKKSTSSE